MSEADEVCRDPQRWWQVLEEAVSYMGLQGVVMGLESICEARVKTDPEHAAYWAVMGYRLGSIVCPPQVMFESPEPPVPRMVKERDEKLAP